MKRITFERKISDFDFSPRLVVYKDGVEFSRLNLELLQDLTLKSPPDSPFKGPELSRDDARKTIMEVLKADLNDPELENELHSVIKEYFIK